MYVCTTDRTMEKHNNEVFNMLAQHSYTKLLYFYIIQEEENTNKK